MNSKQLVIIGNSGAALSAIRAIRQEGNSWPVTVVAKETHPAYSPVLTTYYIGDRIDRQRLFLVDDKFYSDLGVEVIFGKEAVDLDLRRQCVRLVDDRELPFDSLLIASGSSAKTLSGDSVAADGLFTLKTLEDAERIKKAARGSRSMVFVGAGLVSLQAASQLHRDGLHMAFVVGSDRVLSQNLDPESSKIVQARIEKMGPSFFFRREIKQIEKKDGKRIVTTSRNEVEEADLVFVGKGVTPNLDFARGKLEVGPGIVVNERLQTSVDNVYAAGDVTAGRNPRTKAIGNIANWPNACLQGKIAGLNMIGQEEPFTEFIPRNVTKIFGLSIASLGTPHAPASEAVTFADAEREIYCKIVLQGTKIIGAVLIGVSMGDIGLIYSMIQDGTPVSADPARFSKHLLQLDGFLSFMRKRF